MVTSHKVSGTKICMKRKEAGLSIAQLANLIGVTPAAVTQYELELREPGPSVFGSIARILGVTMDSLLEEREAADSQNGPVKIQEGGA